MRAAAVACLLWVAGCARPGPSIPENAPPSDPEATEETRALFAGLKRLAPDRVLFGHQDALAYGVKWKVEEGRSDVKDVAGSHPAVFGWELGDLELGAPENLDGVNFENMKRWIRQGYDAGGVITISWHMNNPVSGGNAWDRTRAVFAILPGGEKHELYRTWLDTFAEFVGDVKTEDSRPIPIVFRPFHEHTGNWFWWGGANVTADEYIGLWRFTVDYLRGEKGLHNLLFAYSTDVFRDELHYLEHYPGHAYVDILGYDDYQALRTDEGIPLMTRRLRMLVEMAEESGKLPALTETGLEGVPVPNWWTGRLLEAITADSVSRRISYALVWRNANEAGNPGHFFGPHAEHPSAPDFVRFAADPFVLLVDELPDLYRWDGVATPRQSHAQLRVSRLFTDGLVIQRDAHVPIWGWASPGSRVVVTMLGVDYSAIADRNGAWTVLLAPMKAGGPHAITVRRGETELHVRDIMVGDVWLASGQSNMEWVVADAAGRATHDPAIRQFKVPQSWAYQEEDSLAGGAWQQADAEHVGGFTAVGYYFARELREHVGVPVGIINSTWGGSRIEPWMSLDALGLDEEDLAQIRAAEVARQEAIRDRVRSRIGSLPEMDAGLADGVAHWAAPDLDDRNWFTVPVPSQWEAAGFDGMDGVAWYRANFEVTEDDIARGVRLGLGMIDDSDITWVNGVEVGRTDNAWNQARLYDVPSRALKAGENVISIRVEDFQGGGGIAGARETVFLDVGGDRRALPDTWRFMVGRVSLNSAGNKNQVPTLLWNKMIHPLLPFPIKGVIWYQGESNADRMPDAVAYPELFAAMIRSWREEWRQEDLPFLWAQLANFMEVNDDPSAESNWAVLREAQSAALALPHTGQAVLIDIGEADDIHPRNKEDVGRRLALAARKIAYGEDVVFSGPTFRTCEFRDGRATVSFDHVGSGLITRGDAPRGFAVAGPDGRFVWANARIDDDRVVVWSDAVPDPVAVRYAWANNPASANLYNAEGLPAGPFRTDRW